MSYTHFQWWIFDSFWPIFDQVLVDLEFKNETSMSEAHCYENSVHPILTFWFLRKFSSRQIVLHFYCRQIMNYLCQKMQKDWVIETKHVENCSAFEKKLAHVIKHGIQRFILKISKVSQWWQTVLNIFCRTGSVA